MTAIQDRPGGWPGGGGAIGFAASDYGGPLRPAFVTSENNFLEFSNFPKAKACPKGHLAPRVPGTRKCAECFRAKEAARQAAVAVREARRSQPKKIPTRWSEVIFHVYVISADRFVKVGLAESLTKRVAQIRCSCPLPIVVEKVFGPFNRHDARAIEKLSHNRLAARAVRGEWFEVKPSEAIAAVQYAEVFL